MKEKNTTSSVPPPADSALAHYYERHSQLEGIPAATIRRGWFTLSHMLLAPDAHLLDMGCGSGSLSYVMAVLAPQIKVTGIDHDARRINKAKKNYHRPNLSFQTGDISSAAGLKENSVDAIVNSFMLHEVFSSADYDERAVTKTLESQFALLKKDGLMMIHDFALPPSEDYVHLEMPDTSSTGETLDELSEPDLLLWYAAHARPTEDKDCHGFFLEELPPRFPGTRLFRLPYKWAYEFMMRKDRRANIEAELHKEYAFFTPHEYRKTIRHLGARVLYTAPHWEETIIQNKFEGRFRLYSDDNKPMGAPPTSFIAVAQKAAEGESIRLTERRPSHDGQQKNRLRVTSMRNDSDGRLIDVVCRDYDTTEIMPYRITDEGRLNIYLHEAAPRALANTVPRIGKNLDSRGWSGHMTEALAVPTEKLRDMDETALKDTALFARDYLGMKPEGSATLEPGPGFFPAPDTIEERIETRYLEVRPREVPLRPKCISPDMEGFSSMGRIRELDAQSVLNAISVGFLPSSRLEVQILALFQQTGLHAESWSECPLVLKEMNIADDNKTDVRDLVASMAEDDTRFRKSRGAAGQLRTVHSVFVEDGLQKSHSSGIAARDIEFVISDTDSVNKAVVLPLCKDLNGEVMAGVVTEYLPVPQRYKDNGMTVTCPSFTLPREVTTMEQARQYVADQFEVPPENVATMGESYFCHLGITPQRIFPFAVTNVPDFYDGQAHGTTSYTAVKDLWKLLYLDNHDSFMKIVAMSYQQFCNDSDLSLTVSFDKELSAEHDTMVSTRATDITGYYEKQTPK